MLGLTSLTAGGTRPMSPVALHDALSFLSGISYAFALPVASAVSVGRRGIKGLSLTAGVCACHSLGLRGRVGLAREGSCC